MPTSCDPNDLALLAKCFTCLPSVTLQQVQTYLLCQMLSGVATGSVQLLNQSGALSVFPPAADTNVSRGAALIAAVSAAGTGSDIFLGPGTYAITSSITLPAGCTLRGVGDASFISGTGLTDVMIIVRQNNITVSSLKLSSNTTCLGAFSPGSSVTATGIVFRAVTAAGKGGVIWADSQIAGNQQHNIQADVYDCNLSGTDNTGGFGFRGVLSSAASVRMFNCSSFGTVDSVLVSGAVGSLIKIFGGTYLSDTDGITTGGGTDVYCLSCKSRGTGGNDLQNDGGANFSAIYVDFRAGFTGGVINTTPS